MLPDDAPEREQCHSALEKLDRVINEKPERHHDELIEGVRCLVRMRDMLIARRRAGAGPRDLDTHLEHVNAVISVMTAGSFPIVGLQHERLKSARNLLAELMEKAPVAEADGNRTHHPR